MSSFSRFQARNQKRIVAQDKLNTRFIFKGYPSIELKGQNDVSVQAAVVNQQEKDKAYIFTQRANELAVGSVWHAKNLPLLVSEEITIIKNVDWHKYVALICNVEVDGAWGYFKGPEKSYINVSLQEDAAWDSGQKPVLVLPEKVLSFEDKIVIRGRPWLIQEYDAISTPGLIYYSLTPTTVSKEIAAQNEGKDIYIEKKNTDLVINIPEEPISTLQDVNMVTIGANIDIALPTEDGYFKTSNQNINIKKRSRTEVIFALPFGVNDVTIQTKQKGDIVETTYRAV